MDFRILGPLDVRGGHGAATLKGRTQRAALLLLLLNADELVSVDRLIDDVWRGATSVKSAQVAVGRVRAALRDAGAPMPLVTREHGYCLEVGGDHTLDQRTFELCLETGQQLLRDRRPEEAISWIETALDLWYGPALGEFACEPWAVAEARRLEELRVVAFEARLDAILAFGDDASTIPELERLTRVYPDRERMRAQLMLALYRSGRQADALRVFRHAREFLVEEYGLEPGEELRALNQAIISQDPALASPRGQSSGEVTVRTRASTPPAERLSMQDVRFAPPDSPLVGRRAELERMFDAFHATTRGAPPLLVLTGEPGIGKTRLAQEFSDSIAASGSLVAWGRCFEAEATAAYRPVATALRSVIGALPDGWLAAAVGREEAAVAVLLPELSPLEAAVDPRLRVGGDKRLLLFDSVVQLLTKIAFEAPVTLVIDDIHVADRSTLDLLGHIVRHTRTTCVLPVVTYRDTEVVAADRLTDWFDSGLADRPVCHVPLGA